MPSNQTPNYQLNQWSKDDRVLMEDFNADNAKLDAALKAETDARAAADQAETAAREALAAEVTKRGNCEVHSFTYVGDGTYGQEHPTTIHFQKKPAFVYIQGNYAFLFAVYGRSPIFLLSGSYSSVSQSEHSWEGNTFRFYHPDQARAQFNEKGLTYTIVAFYTMDE